MANTLTNLIPDMYAALEIVSREVVGLIPRVTRNASIERAAKGQTVRNPVAPTASAAAITPAATPPAISDKVYTNRTITLDQFQGAQFYYSGEDDKGLRLAGNYETLFQQNIAQAIRALVTEIETDLAELYYNAGRAYGTAGTTPFASDLSDIAALKQILDKAGTPMADRHLVLGFNAGYNLRQLTQLTNVNQSGSNEMLRMGELGQLMGFGIAESAYIQTHTVGNSTGQDCTATEPIGETTIAYDGGDGGTILVGDTITLAGATDDPDGNATKYVVNTAITNTTGNIVINAPGLLTATSATQEIGLGSTDYVANMAFSRDALVLGMRPPAKPANGDASTDDVVISDPMTGLSFLVSEYKGYHANNYEVSALWGVGKGNPEHQAILMG